ncbi:MAG: hypothetical protein WB755_04145 [Terriglobales bacterium]
MAVSPKIPRPDALRVAVNVRRPAHSSLEIVAKPVKLDFAPNPNHYRPNGKVAKAKPVKRSRGPDLSPRLELAIATENADLDEIWEGHDFSSAE